MSEIKFGSIVEYYSLTSIQHCSCRINDTQFLTLCLQTTDTDFRAVVWEYSGITPTNIYSSDLGFGPSATGGRKAGVCKVTNNLFAISFSGASNSATVRLMEWTGSTFIDYGDQYVGYTASYHDEVVQIENNKIIFAYKDNSLSTPRIRVVCLTCNDGISLTSGSVYTPIAVSGIDYHNIKTVTDGKFMISYRTHSSVYAFIGTSPAGLSDRTVSFGDIKELKATVDAESTSISIQSDSKAVVVFNNVEDAKGSAIACVISDVTITNGDSYNFNVDNEAELSCACNFLDEDHFVVAFSDESDSGRGKAVIGTIDWWTNEIIFESANQFESGNTGGGVNDQGLNIISLEDNLFVINYQDDSDSDHSKIVLGTLHLLPPENISVVPGASKNIISWDSVDGADLYNIYWLQYEYFNDDFSIDLSAWTIYKDTGTETVQISNEKLYGSNSIGTGWHVVNNTNLPVGDFDIQIDLSTYTPDDNNNGVYAIFRALDSYPFSSVNGAEIYYYISSGGSQHNIVSNLWIDSSNYNTPIVIAGQPSKLRITRSGTTISVYYYISSWISVDSRDFGAFAPNLLLASIDGLQNSSNGGIIEFDNFDFYIDLINDGSKISGVTSPYSHTGLTPGYNYIYIIVPEKGGIEGDESDIGNGIPLLLPEKPILSGIPYDSQNIITVSSVNADTIDLYYKLSSGVTKYNGTKIEDVSNPYNHNGLLFHNYYYIAIGINAEGESIPSDEICLKPEFIGKIFNHNELIEQSLLYQYRGRS